MRRNTLEDIGRMAVAVVELRAAAAASRCEADLDGGEWCASAGREHCASCVERYRLYADLRRARNTLSAAIYRLRRRGNGD